MSSGSDSMSDKFALLWAHAPASPLIATPRVGTMEGNGALWHDDEEQANTIHDNDISFDGRCRLEERVNSEPMGIFFPVLPVFDAGFGSRRHDPRVNGLPRMHDITRELSFLGRRNSFQECGCGRGKVLLKKVVRVVNDSDRFGFDGT